MIIFKKFLKNDLKKQNGQVAVFVGLALVALVGMLAYVIDEGSIYESRRSFQTVADSAALAGAQELPENPSAAVEAAVEYAAMHEVTLDPSDVSIESTFVSDDTISVTASDMNKKTLFAGVFGVDSTEVGADATAMVGSPAYYNGAMPWAVLEEDWIPGEEYTLKCGSPGNSGKDKDKDKKPGGPQGNFQALAIGGTGANNYEDNIIYGARVPLSVGDIIDTEPGNMAGPTIKGVEDRIYDQEDGVFNSFEDLVGYVNGVNADDGIFLKRSDSQFVLCPLISELPNGRKDVEILAFVPFLITGYDDHTSEVFGTFLDYALIIHDGDIVAASENGIRVIRLVD